MRPNGLVEGRPEGEGNRPERRLGVLDIDQGYAFGLPRS
jgi:hypothetical protein